MTLDWQSAAQFVATVERGEKALALMIQPMPDGQYLVGAVEKEKGDSVVDVLRCGARVLGMFESLAAALGAADEFAEYWLGRLAPNDLEVN